MNKANETGHKLCQRGYPLRSFKKILTEVKFADRKDDLCNKTKQTKEILSFVTIYNPATLNLKKNLMKHRHIIQQQPKLKQIFNQPPIVSHRKKTSLNDILVQAKISQKSRNNHKISKAVKSELEGNLHMFTADSVLKMAITHPCVYCDTTVTASIYFQISFR